MVLWYVRLRKVVKGSTPFSLLEVERAIQAKNLQGAVGKVKRASLEGYVPYNGEDEDETPMGTESSESDEDENLVYYENQQTLLKNKQKYRELLTAVKFVLKLEGVRATVSIPDKKIVRQHKEEPNLEMQMGIVAVLLGVMEQNVIVKVLLKEIKVVDYYKREEK